MTADELRERLRMLAPQADTVAIMDEWRRLAEDRDRLLTGLGEAHDFACGCDTPGDLLRCVAHPTYAFAWLVARDDEATG